MKRKITLFFIIVLVLASAKSALAFGQNVCSQDDNINISEISGFNLDVDEKTRAENALDWIYTMMEPFGSEENGAHITFDESYDVDYTGDVTGDFTLDNPLDYPTISPTPLVVLNPEPLLDTYRGVVNGTATDILTAGTHEVRAYLFTDAEYEQPAVIPGDVLVDGTWSLDLSPIPANFAGSWYFRLYEKATNTQISESWPKEPILKNLEIRLYSVTDAEYLTGTFRGQPGNQFSFNPSFSGTKRVKIIDTQGTLDTSDDIVLDSFTNGNGVIRSYELFPGDTGYGTGFQERGYVYDQALALSAALVMDDSQKSQELVDGLLLFQETNGIYKGAFVFSAPQPSPVSRDPILRVGAHSIALYSLLQFIDQNPNHLNKQIYIQSSKDAFDYLEIMKSNSGPQSGLYKGGSGRYVADVFEDYIIPWASTEHNLDTWHAFKKAEKVFPEEGYGVSADNLQNIILSKLWNLNTQRFYQGHGEISPDTADALDTNSWGSIFLSGINEDIKSETSLDRLDIYYLNNNIGPSGWGPYSAAGGYAGATPTVWFEGSFGVLMSYAHNGLGDLYKSTLDDLKTGQLLSGAFRYATISDPTYEIITAPSIASSSWYILSTIGIEGFWSECISEPIQDNDDDSDNSHSQGGSLKRICKDPAASNYSDSRFGRHDKSICLYPSEIIVEEENELILPVSIPDNIQNEITLDIKDSVVIKNDVVDEDIQQEITKNEESSQNFVEEIYKPEPIIPEEILPQREYKEDPVVIVNREEKKAFEKDILLKDIENNEKNSYSFLWNYYIEILILIGIILFMGYYLLIWKREKEDKKN